MPRRLFLVSLVVIVVVGGSRQASADSGPDLHERLLRDLRNPWRNGNAVTLGVGTAASLFAMQIEDPNESATTLEGSPFEGLIDVGDLFGSGEVVGVGTAGVLAVGLLSGSNATTDLGLDLASSLAVTSAYTWSLKVAVARRRPSGGPHSFPSGHTALAFATATVLDRHTGPAVSILAYGLAAGTALGRMEDRRHYLSDVVFGAALGLAVGDAQPFTWLRDHLTASSRGLAIRGTF